MATEYIQITARTIPQISFTNDIIDKNFYGTLLERFNMNLPELVSITDTINNSTNTTTITGETLKEAGIITAAENINELFKLAQENQQKMNILTKLKNMREYYSNNLYGNIAQAYSSKISRAAKGQRININSDNRFILNNNEKIPPYIYAEGITESLEIYITVRGIPLRLRRNNLALYKVNSVNRYNAIFSYPEYAFNFKDCEDSWDDIFVNEQDNIMTLYRGNIDKISKLESDPTTLHNLNLIIKAEN